MRVVDRDAKLEAVFVPIRPGVPDREGRREEQRVPDLPIIVLFASADEDAALDDPVLELVPPDLQVVPRDRDLYAVFLADELIEFPVEPLGMDRIDRVLHDLQPVAVDDRAPQDPYRPFVDQTIESRNERRRLRTEISPQQTAELADGIGRRRDFLFERAPRGFVRLFDASSRSVEHPAVIRAADPFRRRDPIVERCATMRTLLGDEAQTARTVLEQDEVLSQQANALRPAVLHLVGRCDGVPVAAEQVPHPRPRPDPGEQLILLGCQHLAGTSLRGDVFRYSALEGCRLRLGQLAVIAPQGARPPRRRLAVM